MPDFRSWISPSKPNVLDLIVPACLCFAVYSWMFSSYVPDAALAAAAFVIVGSLITIKLVLRRPWSDVRNVVLIIALLFLGAATHDHMDWRGHVGDPREYNFTYGECARNDTRFVSGTGSVAVLRQVECSGMPAAAPSRDYFAFVHSNVNSQNDSHSLVLSYRARPGESGWRFEPALRWMKSNTLQVGIRSPSVVWTKRSRLDETKITFVAGGLDIGDDYRLVSCITGRRECDVRRENDNFATIIAKPKQQFH